MNRLKDERSPYLKQHAGNPVDWFPWGEEAREKARREDKPILVSIGYSTCHWCHVMEGESFEDDSVARIMNDNFVSIKVDREEHPHIDSLYMKALQMMTGRGGWPLNIFLTPDCVPFYGGTYFPPDERYGMPSFKAVLESVSTAYRERRGEVEATTKAIREHLEEGLSLHSGVDGAVPGGKSPEGKSLETAEEGPKEVDRGRELSAEAFNGCRIFFDSDHGGFGGGQGGGPKFPYAMFGLYTLRYYERTGEDLALKMVCKTLDEMGRGGIYDHLGGGFHRYSVDGEWEVPHFEKMGYDNGLLALLYGEAFRLTGEERYRRIALETITFFLTVMRSPEGGFYSAMDADTEGAEGLTYTWTIGEVREALGEEGCDLFRRFYEMTEGGNLDGSNVLRLKEGVGEEALHEAGDVRRELLQVRGKRAQPGIDDKQITSWNGLMVRALARCSVTLKVPHLLDEAKRTADFLLRECRDGGRILRYYLGGRGTLKGNLEDYGILGSALVAIYEASDGLEMGEGKERYLEEARGICASMIDLFYDDKQGVFLDTGSDDEVLFLPSRDTVDNDLPSGNAAAADLLITLGRITGEGEFTRLGKRAIASVKGIESSPLSYGHLLTVLEDSIG